MALLFAVLAAGQCPYNCSQHGTCQGTACVCDSPWLPPLCSVFSLGEATCPTAAFGPLPGMLPDDTFTLSVPVTQSRMSLIVQAPGLSLYARLGQAASPSAYDFASDSGSLQVVAARVGEWFMAGVASQNVSGATVNVACGYSCPNNCTQRGTCVQGQCHCSDPSFSGVDCSVWIEQLQPSTPFTWSCDVSAPQPLVALATGGVQTKVPLLSVALLNGTGTVLASRGGSVPNRASFDLRLSGGDGAVAEVVGGRAEGPWLLWLEQCTTDVTVMFDFGAACPNDCHGRGQCDTASASCLCTLPYQLPDCEHYLDSLSDGESRRTHLLQPWQRHVYSLDAMSSPASGLSLLLSSAAPGLVLLLGSGAEPPQLTSYDSMAVTNGSSSDAVLQAGWQEPLLPGQYWAAVLAPAPGALVYPLEYSLSLSLAHKCPGGCGAPGRGQCLPGGVCNCSQPWVLGDCSARSLQVTPDRVLSGVAFVSGWDFYHIQMHSGNAVLVRLAELQGAGGRLWLFVRFGGLPSLSTYLSADLEHTVSHEVLIRSRDASDNATLYIGVFGSALMAPGSSPLSYSLAVTTGCQTYSECGLCVSDPDCGWCLPQPFNSSAGLCVAGTLAAPFAGGLCGTWTFSTCDVSAQQAFVLNLGIVVGVAIGVAVLLAVSLTAYCVYRRIQAEELLKLSRLQNLDRADRDEPAALSPQD